MTTLHYTHVAGSGAARYVAGLCRALAEAGERVVLVCPRDFAPAGELADVVNLSVVHAGQSLAHSGSRLEKLLRAMGQISNGLRVIARAGRPGETVHVNFPGIELLVPILLLGIKLGRHPLVLTVHDVVPHRWRLPRSLRTLELTVLRVTYAIPNRLVVHGASSAADLHSRFAVPDRKIAVIPHGVPPTPQLEPPPATKELTCLLIGSIRRNKGIHLAIDAVQRLRREGLAIRLVIAGAVERSERAYWTACRRLIERQPDRIVVMEGFLSEMDMAQLLRESHCVLLPYGTAFRSQSGVAITALSHGRPIVATRAAGLAQVGLPSNAAIRIAKNDAESVASAIRTAAALPRGELDAMGARGRRLLKAASWSSLAPRYLELYRRTAAK